MEKRIYTYYEKTKIENQTEILEVCEKSWILNGWKLTVLNESSAIAHPFYKEYKEKIDNIPSINPAFYDYHCYIRWLAMSAIGGGVMIDYDVINMSLSDDSIFTNKKMLTIYQGHVPCVVFGTGEQYLAACKKFLELIDNKSCYLQHENSLHTSDMIMIAHGFTKEDCEKINFVEDFPKEGKLIHCCYNCCMNSNVNKLDAMKLLLKNATYNHFDIK